MICIEEETKMANNDENSGDVLERLNKPRHDEEVKRLSADDRRNNVESNNKSAKSDKVLLLFCFLKLKSIVNIY